MPYEALTSHTSLLLLLASLVALAMRDEEVLLEEVFSELVKRYIVGPHTVRRRDAGYACEFMHVLYCISRVWHT